MTARRPDASERIAVHGHEVVTYSYGSGDEVLFLLNGGPGLPCNYLRDPMLRMVDEGYRVVTYDQLGCGASDRPASPRTSIRVIRAARMSSRTIPSAIVWAGTRTAAR